MNALRLAATRRAPVRAFVPGARCLSSSPAITDYGSPDPYFTKDRLSKTASDDNSKNFNYFMLGNMRFVYATTARLALIKFVASMNPSADVLALASAEFDLSAIDEGATITVKWRGKPIFIKKRTAEEIATEAAVDVSTLRDQETDAERVQKDEILVVMGVCTHLGCVPISGAGEFGGWFCPCHGSHYDGSGRIRKGPAPLNLEIPPYKFIEEQKILVG
uniref:Cytochrome b-c1 complex subunit Rieske, mitochondrial n=1 Tax=Phaeomonas parva TaxID=124430 RepID=A0A7S1TPF0_9STRA|mmetsp:Transcript_11604/g.35237  ORF Transcript_11604/g.35237 Transcript_11604/m.35237 type:complete len:219 (+) Transcript_11604:65-721(+)|eukprot:CAMPEP_0118888446 /NCGR_PEP_ID=MMETSP1163-20130328/25724_1 /TAXON_ID=124430 /ORGANISM="Phaeomonas parva, Strain CCMP2877" /LENGTH=218 /DNA_ID=CAMNT_0006827011 /DNA_START=68 /DNA_END=724 /DNA_ORIENTATION=-